MTNLNLISDLTTRTEWCLAAAQNFRDLSPEILNRRPQPNAWSALECMEHLNRYGDFYLPAIQKALKGAPDSGSNHTFSPGWMGDKFALSMLPLPEGGKKMSTFKSMNPHGSELGLEVLQKFIDQQEEMLTILPRCVKADLVKRKTGITLTRFIQLRLGDTLRVVIYHNQRHMQQAIRAAKVESEVALG